MTDLSIRFENQRLLQAALRRAPTSVASRVDRALQRTALEGAREERALAPKAFSILTNSIGVDREGRLAWRAGPHVDYALAVERGTRGGGSPPPFDHILDWVKLRRLEPYSPRLAAIADPERRQRSLAWAISRSIARLGTPAQPFVAPVARSGAFARRHRRRVLLAMRQGLRQARVTHG